MPNTRRVATTRAAKCRSPRSARSSGSASRHEAPLAPRVPAAAAGARRRPAVRADRRLGAHAALRPRGGQGRAVDGLPLDERRAALARRNGYPARAPDSRAQAAPRAPAHGALRGDPRRPRPAARARGDRGGERLSQVRRVARRRARLHAGDAVLGQTHRPAQPQPLSPAHEPRLRLRHPAPLSRHRERRLFPRARTLQRLARAAGISQGGARRMARTLEIRWTDRMINALLDKRPKLANWFYGFTPPERGVVVLVHRRVYILPTQLGWLFVMTLAILLIGSINYALSLGFALTFLLAGMGLAGMVHTARNLARMAISVGRAEPIFAGEAAQFRLYLDARSAFDRPAILVRHLQSRSQMVVDVPAAGLAEVVLAVPAARRGWLPLGRVMLETRFPLGIFRSWSYVEPAARCLVYPRPERSALPTPSAEAARGTLP